MASTHVISNFTFTVMRTPNLVTVSRDS
jgi:hypothetical protein